MTVGYDLVVLIKNLELEFRRLRFSLYVNLTDYPFINLVKMERYSSDDQIWPTKVTVSNKKIMNVGYDLIELLMKLEL